MNLLAEDIDLALEDINSVLAFYYAGKLRGGQAVNLIVDIIDELNELYDALYEL